MRLDQAIDTYLEAMVAQGSLRSEHSLAAYRTKLTILGEHVGNRDPRTIGRDELRAVLGRWPNPNSLRQALAIYRSFFDFAMEEGWRRDNPARQIRRPRPRQAQVYRLTRQEVGQMMDASMSVQRWRWLVHLGLLSGARRAELAGLQGKHLRREGWVWISADIAKGGKERWVPVLPELAPIVEEILALVGPDQYVLGRRRNATTANRTHIIEHGRPLSHTTVHRDVKQVAAQAGLSSAIAPHTLRHAFGDHVARWAGLRAAQALMGHENVETTATVYVDRVTLDELAVSVQGFRYRELPTPNPAEKPDSHADAR